MSGNAGNEAVLGLLSQVFWAMMVVVTTKYVCFVMGADNDCEGGIIALLTLASAAVVDPTRAVRVRVGTALHAPKRTAPAPLPERLRCPSAMEWERFCTSADRRLVILFGPQAAFRLRDKAAPTA